MHFLELTTVIGEGNKTSMTLRELLLRLLGVTSGQRPRPLWKRNNQDKWFWGASIHANDTKAGTPPQARKVWDDIIQLDPNAPPEYRPFWAMKIDGEEISEDFYSEIKERTDKGYRVIFTRKVGGTAVLINDVENMQARKCLPWGVSLGNEPEFGEALTPDEFYDGIIASNLPTVLTNLHNKYGVMVSPPGMSSFANVILNGYGAKIKLAFAGVPGMFLKVHQYGSVRPEYFVEFDLKTKCQEVCGLEGKYIIIEEIANNFVDQSGIPADKVGVSDDQGADYFSSSWYAAMQTQMPTCHFMLYHTGHHLNDISDETYGFLRRQKAKSIMNWVRGKNDIGTIADTYLENPRGMVLTAEDFE